MRNVFAALRPARNRPHLKLVKPAPAPVVDRVTAPTATPGIEAAEAAAAVGLDPATPQLILWRAKTSHASDVPEPPSWPQTSARYWKTLLEPLVAAVYTKRSGNALRRINLLTRHPAHPWMQARVDWEVLGCPEVDLMRYLSVGKEEAPVWEHGLPGHERLNALHLLAVTGKQAVDLAVLVCGQELQIHRVVRDEPVIARLMQLESRFWRCVELNQLPSAGGSLLALSPVTTGGEVVRASP